MPEDATLRTDGDRSLSEAARSDCTDKVAVPDCDSSTWAAAIRAAAREALGHLSLSDAIGRRRARVQPADIRSPASIFSMGSSIRKALFPA
jgi:hypothetical protein